MSNKWRQQLYTDWVIHNQKGDEEHKHEGPSELRGGVKMSLMTSTHEWFVFSNVVKKPQINRNKLWRNELTFSYFTFGKTKHCY